MSSEKESLNNHLEEDFQVLRSITSELIHENAELKNSVDEKESELELLYSLIRRITFVMDWKEIQEMVVELIMDFFSVVRFCMLALYDERQGLVIRYRDRNDARQEAVRIALPFEVDESTKWDSIVASEEWNDFFQNLEHVRTLQSSFVPLALKDRELGFMMIGKLKNLKYGRGEWQFLTTITNYCAVALDNSKLYEFATTDALTGLFNRRYFMHRLEREMERASRRNADLSLLMADIDSFKNINDTFGHQAGDQVLIDLGARLNAVTRNGGVVNRFGGEEFTILLPNVNKKNAAAMAEEIRAAIAGEPFVFNSDGREIIVNITVSVGVAVFPHDAGDAMRIIDKADQALYLAKAHGKNCVMAHQ
jgi:diguanylate cyclase (GGDEF)-like protein